MKKLLSITTILLLAGLLISSCSSLSITKRRYNKGFFVEHHKKPQSVPKHSPEVAAAQAPEDKPEVVPMNPAPRAEVEHVKPLQEKKTLTASAPKQHKNSTSLNSTHDAVELAVKSPVRALKEAGTLVKMADPASDALSLLWVVIVVILILYLLGLLFGDFGGLIHILAIVAVVLLILWLLRIL